MNVGAPEQFRPGPGLQELARSLVLLATHKYIPEWAKNVQIAKVVQTLPDMVAVELRIGFETYGIDIYYAEEPIVMEGDQRWLEENESEPTEREPIEQGGKPSEPS